MYPQYMNPVNDFYFRNAQATFNQPTMQFPPQQNQINSRFVTNVEEARAAMIDPLSYNLFLDTNTGKIYLKKLGNNGQSEFLCYTIEEVKEDVKDPFREINTRLSKIEGYLGGLKNDKSVSDVQQSAGNITADITEQNEPDAETESAGLSKNARNDKWKK